MPFLGVPPQLSWPAVVARDKTTALRRVQRAIARSDMVAGATAIAAYVDACAFEDYMIASEAASA